MNIRLPALVVLCLTVVASMTAAGTRAQEAGDPFLSLTQIDASEYPSIRGVVTALDGDGAPVDSLTVDDVVVAEGGEAVTVEGLQRFADVEETSLGVVLVLDTSSSMQGAPLDLAKQAANDFVRSLGPEDSAAVIGFGESASVVVPLTRARPDLINGISSLGAGGGSALHEAVQAALFMATLGEEERQAIVLLTDGGNDTATSSATASDALGSAEALGVPIFSIALGPDADREHLDALAAASGGITRASNAGSLEEAFGEYAAILESQYRLSVEGSALRDGSESSLEVTATIGGAEVEATASFRRGEVTPTSAGSDETSEGSSFSERAESVAQVLLIVMGVVAVIVAAGAVGYWVYSYVRQRQLTRQQLEIVEPNAALAAKQGLPSREGTVVQVTPPAPQQGSGVLVEKGGEGRTFELGGGPIVIGASPRYANIVIDGFDVAPEHVRIWLRGGRYLIHHVGGMSRKTYVNGAEADWVTLEPGDELRVGEHRYVFRDLDLEEERPNPFLPKGRITPLTD